MAAKCRSCLNKEFRCKRLGHSDIEPSSLYTPRWQWPEPVYPIYRTIGGLYTLAVSIYGLQIMTQFTHLTRHHWLCFLTNWSFIVFTSYHVYSMMIVVLCTIRDHVNNRKRLSTTDNSPPAVNGEPLPAGIRNVPWYLRIRWFLFDIVTPVTILITLLYYGMVFQYTKRFVLASPSRTFLDLTLHAMPSVYTLGDLFISGLRIRVIHCVYSVIFCLVYLLFTVIYWAVDKDNNVLYDVLDWNEPGWAVLITISAIFGCILIWLIMYLFQWALDKLQQNCCHRMEGESLASNMVTEDVDLQEMS